MQNENIIRRVGPDKVATGRLLIMTLNGKHTHNINCQEFKQIKSSIFEFEKW